MSGIVCDDPTELAQAIGRAGELSPASSRRWARERFDVGVLTAGYERVYRQLLDRAAGRSRRRLVAVSVKNGGLRPA